MDTDEQTIADYIALLNSTHGVVQPEATRAMLDAADRLCPTGSENQPPPVNEAFEQLGALEARRSPSRRVVIAAVMFCLGMASVTVGKLAMNLAVP